MTQKAKELGMKKELILEMLQDFLIDDKKLPQKIWQYYQRHF